MSPRPELPQEAEQYGSYVGRVARGAGISSFGQGVGKILGFFTQLALAWFYGAAQIGFYALGMTVIQLANILSQIGMDNGVVRYVAKYRAEGDSARVRGTIIQAVRVTFVISVVISAGIFFGSPLIAGVLDEPFMERVLRYFALSLPFMTLMSMTMWAAQGFQTIKYATLVQQVYRPFLTLVFVIIFYLLGFQILGAVAAYALSMFVGAALGFYYLYRIYPKITDRSIPPKYETRELFSVSGPMILSNFSQYINTWIAVAALGLFAPVQAVGVYHITSRTAQLCALVLLAFTRIFSPMISSLYSQGLMDDLGRLYKDVSRWTFTGSLAVFLLIATLATDILLIFGERFTEGAPVMVLIAGALLFGSSVGHTGRVLAMTGRQNLVLLATVSSAVTGFALSFTLVPLYGIYGAGIATAAAIVVLNTITLFFVWRQLGFWPYNQEYLKPLVAGLVAAALVPLGKAFLPVPDGLLSVAVLGSLFGLGFLGLLVVFGLSESDRGFLSAVWVAVRRNLRLGT
jgi:O-antigen/teichoic acid export membrane protein